MSNKYSDIDSRLANQRFCCCVCPCCAKVRECCAAVSNACIECCQGVYGIIYIAVFTICSMIDFGLKKIGFYSLCAKVSEFCLQCWDVLKIILSYACACPTCRKYLTRGCAHCRYPMLFIERKDSLTCCMVSLLVLAIAVLSVMGILTLIVSSSISSEPFLFKK